MYWYSEHSLRYNHKDSIEIKTKDTTKCFNVVVVNYIVILQLRILENMGVFIHVIFKYKAAVFKLFILRLFCGNLTRPLTSWTLKNWITLLYIFFNIRLIRLSRVVLLSRQFIAARLLIIDHVIFLIEYPGGDNETWTYINTSSNWSLF